jgi:phosphonate transport system substrate-binding protein
MNSLRGTAYGWLGGFFLMSTTSFLYAQEARPERVTLNVGFGRTSFLNVNLSDAKAAFKAFTQTVGRENGYELDVVVHTYDSDEAFTSAVASHSLHLVVMVTWNYLSASLNEYIEPSFAAIESGHGPREYLLLVPTNSVYANVEDLRDKRVILLENANCELSRQWLQTLLLEHGVEEKAEIFFERLEVETKAAKVLLPVFFGNADASVVSRPVFETMCELNPQVGRKLRSVAVSEPLVDSVIYLATDGWAKPKHRIDLIESLETLHKSPYGRQILTLFKVERLAPFKEALMEGTRRLKEKHDRLASGREGK